MAFLGNTLLLLSLVMACVLAVVAIVRGYKGLKMSKRFPAENKKMKAGFWLVSAIHMWSGILIAVFYVIAGIIIINQF